MSGIGISSTQLPILNLLAKTNRQQKHHFHPFPNHRVFLWIIGRTFPVPPPHPLAIICIDRRPIYRIDIKETIINLCHSKTTISHSFHPPKKPKSPNCYLPQKTPTLHLSAPFQYMPKHPDLLVDPIAIFLQCVHDLNLHPQRLHSPPSQPCPHR